MTNSNPLMSIGEGSPFDQIRQVRPDGTEYWSARDLMPLLGYDQWRNFERCITEARHAAEIAGASDQFADSSKMVSTGSGAQRAVVDVHLTRYAAYMVAMSCDGRKQEVAAAKTYFAIRTHEAEARPRLDPSTPAGVLAMAEQFAATARQLVLESEARKQLEAKVEHDAPLVAKAEAHTASTKAIHRQEFAREVQAWAMRAHGLRVLQQQVYAILAHKGMTIGGNRSDAGHATAHAVAMGWAWTDKGEAENGHRYATTKLNPKGQDIAWKWITKYIDENGTLELPREITGGTAA